MDGFLSLSLVDLDQGIYVVKGIEEEVRIDLALQVGEFGLGPEHLGLLAFVLIPVPSSGHPYRYRDADYAQIADGIAYNQAEMPDEWHRTPVRPDVGCDRKCVLENQMHQETDQGDQQKVPQYELSELPAVKILLD